MSMSSPTESLVALAARKQLPPHQYTDPSTVQWIEANRPEFSTEKPPPLRPAVRRLLYRSAIPATWLAERKCMNSLHGIRHAMRTAALAALLAETAALNEADTATLILAAAVHDCRRLHDKDDPGHGARAARWLTDNAAQVWDHFHLPVAQRATVQAATTVRLHDVPYSAFTPQDQADHADHALISDLLKAADALDRYRLPKLSWWPNPQHLRITIPTPLYATAFDLVVKSEVAHLGGLSSADAIFHVLEQQEVIR
jgi:hypothetical protein